MPPPPAWNLLLWFISELQLPSTPLRLPVLSTSYLWFSVTSSPWSSLRWLHGLPSLYPTLTPTRLYHLPIKNSTTGYLPLTIVIYLQDGPKSPRPTDIPSNKQQFFVILVQGYSRELELIHYFYQFIYLYKIHTENNIPWSLGQIQVPPSQPHICCSVSTGSISALLDQFYFW